MTTKTYPTSSVPIYYDKNFNRVSLTRLNTAPSTFARTRISQPNERNLPMPTLDKRVAVLMGVAVMILMASMALCLAATGGLNWFVVNVPGYNSNYGVFEAQINCAASASQPTTVFTGGPTTPVCQTGGYTCTNAGFCSLFSAFQVLAITACALSILSLPFVCLHLFALATTRVLQTTIKRITTTLLLLTLLAQLLSIVAFTMFINQASAGVAVPGVSGFFVSGQVLSGGGGVQGNLPNSAFGGVGSSFVVMVVGLVVGVVGSAAFWGVMWKLGKEV
ncbi:hypothetical protein HDU98_005754 [Podochytrium sp. JEL0797]|nr:hypothetical protein HDU98_005754 [Podochytrium sp. JEL0797]